MDFDRMARSTSHTHRTRYPKSTHSEELKNSYSDFGYLRSHTIPEVYTFGETEE